MTCYNKYRYYYINLYILFNLVTYSGFLPIMELPMYCLILIKYYDMDYDGGTHLFFPKLQKIIRLKESYPIIMFNKVNDMILYDMNTYPAN